MECAMQLAACAAGCVRAQHALGVLRSSMLRRSCMGLCTLCACASGMRASSMLDMHQSRLLPSLRAFKLGGPPKMTGSWWIQRWGAPLAAFALHWSINLLLYLWGTKTNRCLWH